MGAPSSVHVEQCWGSPGGSQQCGKAAQHLRHPAHVGPGFWWEPWVVQSWVAPMSQPDHRLQSETGCPGLCRHGPSPALSLGPCPKPRPLQLPTGAPPTHRAPRGPQLQGTQTIRPPPGGRGFLPRYPTVSQKTGTS